MLGLGSPETDIEKSKVQHETVLPVRTPNLAMQCAQIQISHHYVALWPGHVFHALPLVLSPRLSNLPCWSLKDGNAFLEKELKECSGGVLVDSVPEFCLPETELIDLLTVDVVLISIRA